MKTLEEFIKEIEASKGLQEELKNVKDKEAAEAFLKKHECGASVEEFVKYVKGQSEGAIEDEDVLMIAGGSPIFSQSGLTVPVQPVL